MAEAFRLNVLTVIHNFGLTRLDGTTAAKRLFERDVIAQRANSSGQAPVSTTTLTHRAYKKNALKILNL